MIQRKSINSKEISEIPIIIHEVLHSPGKSLDPATRELMRPRVGHNFNTIPLYHVHRIIHRQPAKPPTTMPTTCTKTDQTNTTKFAEQGRTDTLSWVQLAQKGLDRLHSTWISNKSDLAGTRTLQGVPVCAFNSNFNIDQSDPEYGVRQIRVSNRLRQLEKRLSKAVPYACSPDSDPMCSGKNMDTVAYVVNHQPPIHFCPQFYTDVDPLNRQTVVTHEFAHLLPGVGDDGGYAMGGLFGAQVVTCSRNFKFKAASDVLAKTADALAGFVMHIGQKNDVNVQVR